MKERQFSLKTPAPAAIQAAFWFNASRYVEEEEVRKSLVRLLCLSLLDFQRIPTTIITRHRLRHRTNTPALPLIV
jgi:hypothetical protein